MFQESGTDGLMQIPFWFDCIGYTQKGQFYFMIDGKTLVSDLIEVSPGEDYDSETPTKINV